MRFRHITLAAVGLAFILVGCTGDATRSTSPREPVVLALENLTEAELGHWTRALSPPSNTLGSGVSLLNAIKNASDQQAAADALLAFMLNSYDAGQLKVPDPPRADGTLLGELLAYLHAVAGFYGITYDIPDLDVDTDLEHVIEILTESDFPDDDTEICVPTNVGNAAVCLKKPNANLPGFLSIFQVLETDEGYVFPMPPGFAKTGDVFVFNAYSLINQSGEGVTAVLCVPPGHLNNIEHHLFKDDHESEFAELKPANTQVDHTCPQGETSFLKGNGLFARGVNAAGSLLMSALSPKPAYGSHSLAHGGNFAFSHWAVGAEEDYDVRIVRTVPPATNTDFTAIFKQSGGFTMWLEITRNGHIVTCNDQSVGIADVQARATASTGHASAWISANRCESVGGTSAFVVEIPNPRNNRVSSGVIDVRVKGIDAEPQLTYNATL